MGKRLRGKITHKDLGSNSFRRVRKPVAAVTAEVALNLSVALAVFAVSLAAAHGAGYFRSFRIASKKVL
jgi:hypothetical protein